MYFTIIRLFKKIIILSIITILPIIVYSYINDNTKLTFNIKKETQYEINAKFLSEKHIAIEERIIYFNNKNKLNKLFIKLGNLNIKKSYDISNIKINNLKVNYKTFGNNNNILMLKLNTPIKKHTTTVIDTKYILELKDIKETDYSLEKWYPVLTFYREDNWYENNEKIVKIKITTPKEFILKVNNFYRYKKEEDMNIYYIESVNDNVDILITRVK
ncbi:MAG: M1 family metallopeptidase [Firmicutes bacterium]|nr:M1 family metallopeptidase [Bacillota bacterium]